MAAVVVVGGDAFVLFGDIMLFKVGSRNACSSFPHAQTGLIYAYMHFRPPKRRASTVLSSVKPNRLSLYFFFSHARGRTVGRGDDITSFHIIS